ncbi:pyroglutamyl-peptidase I [Staphylococcus sp. ACRSN]|uniref:pyroglutamyl-peptidase I n=1 Tax=Staphylococcus sp. ACRSN TaxID=2918214 RepID=UPI001EF1CBA3|nr:pyroglutamyl-peptidase I [Staphylococcus sp. ACRSN]MCG7338114.1 pyroglutamyl-peptidase I [Staphylococcus sp. ACRSN]
MKVLVTGFDSFGKETLNPSWEAIKLLPDNIGEHRIEKLKLPTVFHKSQTLIESKLQSDVYHIVLSVGQAGGRFEITPERVGINIDDASIADNEGQQPIDKIIQMDGASAYFSNLPVKRMTEAMKSKGIPASLSNTAGTFVCNHVLYQLGYLQDKKFPNLKFGFIHVPFIPKQVINKVNEPSMSLNTIVKGLTVAIEAALVLSEDIHISLGKIN